MHDADGYRDGPQNATGWRAWFLVALFLSLLIAALSPAWAAKPVFPDFTGNVVDTADALPAADEAALSAKLEAFQQRTKQQLVVVTLPYDPDRDIADYGYRLGREWAVGMREVNNGVLLLVVPNGPVGKRDVRIEVGYGLEPVLTDALSSMIVNETIIPRFRAGDIPGGIAAGADAIMSQLAAPDADQQKKIDAANAAAQSGAEDSGGGGLVAAVFVLVFMFVALSMFRRRGRNGLKAERYGGSNWPIILWSIANALSQGARDRDDDDDHGGWGGGGGGGGFSGGGGGSFGGGGASGSW